jgi:hypothetical protein
MCWKETSKTKIARFVVIGANHNSNWQDLEQRKASWVLELAGQKETWSSKLQGIIFNGGRNSSFN